MGELIRGNAVIGQSGGPTAVINQSLVGVIEGLRAGLHASGHVPRILGMKHGVRGLVKEWRAEPALQMTSTLAGILNRLPTATTTALFGGMLKCCDFVATNVPGAPIPVYSAGSRVDGLYAFAPTAGAAVNVSLISHCDTCCIGVVVDTTAVPDPAALVACLREGFDEVLAQS